MRIPKFQRFYSPSDVMPNPEGPPANAPVNEPPAVPPARRGGIECAFCECQIAPDGGVLKTSDRARALAKSADTIADLRATIADLKAEIATLKAAHPAPPAPKKKSHPLDFAG